MEGVRSLLFVPAEEKKLAKIGIVNADAYIIDLEDSIPQKNKDMALERTLEFLRTCDIENLFVRINRSRYFMELEVLDQFHIGFVLPKVESKTDYNKAKNILQKHRVIALIESAVGVINSNSIASIPWVTALAFGAEDFTMATNISNDIDSLVVPKSMLALAAKANQKMIYDTPCFFINDEEILGSELSQAVKLGYDGKLAIHPAQIDLINSAFIPLEKEYAKYIIKEFESSGDAVCEIDGRVFEKLHIDRFKKMIMTDEKRNED